MPGSLTARRLSMAHAEAWLAMARHSAVPPELWYEAMVVLLAERAPA